VVWGRCGPVVIMELLRTHDSERPHLLMSSSLIPRRRRGVRYRLASLLAVAVAVCVVLAGACTFAAIADWAADLDPPTGPGRARSVGFRLPARCGGCWSISTPPCCRRC
jgi:hypothetical protein